MQPHKARALNSAPPAQLKHFEATMNARHYLKAPRSVGDYLRQIVYTPKGDIVALLE
jgi:hypothetical protein